MPTTVNCFRRGMRPAGVTWPCGAISVTLVAHVQPQRARELDAEHDAELAGLEGGEAARRMCLPKSATLSSSSGTMPRTKTPRTAGPWRAAPAPSRRARRPTTCGFSLRLRGDRFPVGDAASRRPSIWTCAAAPRMRARISFSKPFITDITVISAAMPSAMPSIEMSEMKEMKWVRRLARV